MPSLYLSKWMRFDLIYLSKWMMNGGFLLVKRVFLGSCYSLGEAIEMGWSIKYKVYYFGMACDLVRH